MLNWNLIHRRVIIWFVLESHGSFLWLLGLMVGLVLCLVLGVLVWISSVGILYILPGASWFILLVDAIISFHIDVSCAYMFRPIQDVDDSFVWRSISVGLDVDAFLYEKVPPFMESGFFALPDIVWAETSQEIIRQIFPPHDDFGICIVH